MGGVVPAVNLKGVAARPAQARPARCWRDIYLGKITKWNDPAIADAQPGLKLPDKAIAVVHRSDGSGTTFIFTNYLVEGQRRVEGQGRRDTSVDFPGGLGGKGNEGVAALVAPHRRRHRLRRIRVRAAEQDDLHAAANSAGNFVAPNAKTFQAAAANADWSKAPGFYLLLTDQPGAESWPITGATFILMHKQPDKPDNAREVLSSSPGRTAMADSWPSSSTTCRCRRGDQGGRRQLEARSWTGRQAGLERPRILISSARRAGPQHVPSIANSSCRREPASTADDTGRAGGDGKEIGGHRTDPRL